ncbi:MAG: hypothetical protein J6A06_08010, partial [Fibrobacteraceae bacterium]|nr:hypothetical protein [Fibrobacteraceae bacterium]
KMTLAQLIEVVREYRRLQTEYERTSNMRTRSEMARLGKRIDAMLDAHDSYAQLTQPKQQELPWPDEDINP